MSKTTIKKSLFYKDFEDWHFGKLYFILYKVAKIKFISILTNVRNLFW